MVASPSRNSTIAESALTIRQLSFGFAKQTRVLHDLSLQVEEGEIVSILGRSGCGKSTLLNLIAGFAQPLSGEIEIRNSQSSKRSIGYIFQEDALFPWRTVGANLALAKEIGGISKEQFEARRKELLIGFHLDESILTKYPAQLSGGMKQRVSIIQTLLFNPALLLLDEPFSALDCYTRLSLETEFSLFVKKHNITALLVTHDIEEAIALSDRVILLNQHGMIQQEISISFDAKDQTPETVRCLPEFGEYYRIILEHFKAAVGR